MRTCSWRVRPLRVNGMVDVAEAVAGRVVEAIARTLHAVTIPPEVGWAGLEKEWED